MIAANKNTRTAIWVCLASAVLLCGCISMKSDVSELQMEGSSRHVPLLIYSTSWNFNGYPYGVTAPIPMRVALINTGSSQIASIRLTLGGIIGLCGSDIFVPRFKVGINSVTVDGPFLLGHPYEVNLAWPILRKRNAASIQSVLGCTSTHLVIEAVSITDETGKEIVYSGRSVSKLLTSNISN